ncbi:MAG: threonine--tRNA ligase [Candidatus Paceibacterota bacterium]|jgi:threonyl-tRNA synthetase
MEKQLEKIDILRHSAAHVLAAAVLEMFPKAKFAIGPSIEDGFYYDFDLPRSLAQEDLPELEKKMKAIIKKNFVFERKEMPIKEAIEFFKKAEQLYKVELIEDLVKNEKIETVSIYASGEFVDLCRGPHLESTGKIGAEAFKLMKIAGAYWRGDEKNKMLQRIYGTAWETKADLESYLKKIEEAEKRDHRKIGKDQDLFSFHEVAPGMPFFHPKGVIVCNELKNFWIESQKEFDYDTIFCPSMLDVSMWKQSGHWDHYQEDMYFIKAGKDEKEFALRPMDCPGAILVYNNSPKSYRDLPLRYAEMGLITRKEKSGQLNGLFRVQQFVQDDAHIFIAEDQIEKEMKGVIALVDKIYKPFGLKYKAFLSTRPDGYMGDLASWEKAEAALRKVLNEVYGEGNYGLKEKDGAFYGPKIDYQLEDAIGRTWQCATIQLDFQMPGKFECKYINNEGKEQQPVLIHRTIMGSFERFMGILIEHYAGAFPVWLAPEQVWVLPIAERHQEYANKVVEMLRNENIRVKMRSESETIGKKIRAGQMQKIPYLLVVGDKEIEAEGAAVRDRIKGDLGIMPVRDFIAKITEEIKEKK